MGTGVPLLNLEQVPPTVYITRGQCESRTICVPDACPLPMRRSVAWCVEDFHLHKQLYKGKASLLYSATCRLSNILIALKLYRKEKLSNLNWFQVEREIRIHSQLKHENIIQLFAAFEDSDNVYLAQELAEGGDLYEDLKTNGGKIDEARVASRIIHPCMQALAYLHKLGIIHRDIKSENILLTADRTVKLADFGLSINHREERPVTRAGTLDMMAPEVLVCPEKSRPEENKERAMLEYTDAVDTWAIGVVAFELLVGHPPFEKESRSETYEHIMYRAPVMPLSISSSAKSFITAALVKAVSKRPSVDQLLGHSWLHHYLQLPAARTTEGQSNAEQKKAEPSTSSVSITIDCTVGITQSTSAGSNASSSGSADTLEVFKADTTGPPKPSVLQWAGSSLKTITKKLRKASNPQPGFDSQLPMQQGAYAPQAASASLPAPASSDLIQDPPARLQLQISVPAAYHEHYAEQAVEALVIPESQQMLHFASLAAATEPLASPRQSMGTRQPSRLRSAQPGPFVGPRQASFRMLKPPPPPPVTRSLASLCLGEREDQTEDAEGHRRRSLLATKAGLEAHPPSPPAYLSRPWTTKRMPRSDAELPPTSPIAYPPSPLARRRRRLAGNNDTSSSGSMSLADTPKGGHFPSGPKSARAFGRPGTINNVGSPGKRVTGEDGKQLRMHNSPFLLGKSNQWTALSPTRSTLTARAEQGSNTLPRDMGNPARDPAFKRAASATPGALPVARKLSLESQRAL